MAPDAPRAGHHRGTAPSRFFGRLAIRSRDDKAPRLIPGLLTASACRICCECRLRGALYSAALVKVFRCGSRREGACGAGVGPALDNLHPLGRREPNLQISIADVETGLPPERSENVADRESTYVRWIRTGTDQASRGHAPVPNWWQGESRYCCCGHPRTHATWHRVAPILAEQYTVVCPDLPGFGQSSKPADTPDHAGSSRRGKARDCVALMRQLGFGRFGLVGHDRGSYTAFRTAMDHPDSVSRLAILDGIPIADALARCDARFASAWWNWTGNLS
ncbi:alpha/beta fold hydrolase [Mesorhizobium sp. M1163]|uniref:alpha/beta fold hydrolase n=1 Tax=Mesorhizobium sp. M1163 TaxID=2957065 RepID=UPI00333969A3